jgi:chromate transporter
MVPLAQLFLVFLKIGAFGFGGPYSLLAIMQQEVVERRQWLTSEEYTESIAIGTLTPGPIFFAAAVFVGYRLRGLRGAALTGLGALAPSFVLVVIVAAVYVQVQQNAWVLAASRGLSAAVVGLFVSVVWRTGRAAVTDIFSLAFVVALFILLAIFRTDPLALIVIAGAGGGWLLRPKRFGEAEGN